MSHRFNLSGKRMRRQLSEKIAEAEKENPGIKAVWDAIVENVEKKEEKQRSAKSNKPESTRKQEAKTKLEMILNLNAESRAYVEAGEYYAAYGLLSTQIQLGEEANFAMVELNFYKVLISTGRYSVAKGARERFIKILQDNLKTTPKECELVGDKYFSQHEYIKAILLYQAGEALFLPTFIETDNLRHCLQGCALGLKLSLAKLVKLRPDLRFLIAKEVIPGMRRIYEKLRMLAAAKTKKAILVQSQCLHHIETTQLKADDPSIREETLREALNMMETELGPEEVWKCKMYSCHLNNLGATLMSLNRLQEAVAIYNDAIKANESATDFDSDIEKLLDLQRSKRGLEKAEEMIKILNQQQQSSDTALVSSSNTTTPEVFTSTTGIVMTRATITQQIMYISEQTSTSTNDE